MSIHVGLVRQIKENGLAEVQTDRRNACGGCQSSDGCRACLSGGGKLLSQVLNPIDAKPGDLVAIELKSGNLLRGAALFYIFPIVLLVIGVLLGASAGAVIGMTETGRGILFGLIGLCIGMALVRWIAGSKTGMNWFSPRISKIIHRDGTTTHISPFHGSIKKQSCCG